MIPQNERHVAWEPSGKAQNERHAAWERSRRPGGPDGSAQKDLPKMSQTFIFKYFLTFYGTPLEHPSACVKQMDQPKWTAKGSQGDCAKYYVLQHIFKILSFCGRSRRALIFQKT